MALDCFPTVHVSCCFSLLWAGMETRTHRVVPKERKTCPPGNSTHTSPHGSPPQDLTTLALSHGVAYVPATQWPAWWSEHGRTLSVASMSLRTLRGPRSTGWAMAQDGIEPLIGQMWRGDNRMLVIVNYTQPLAEYRNQRLNWQPSRRTSHFQALGHIAIQMPSKASILLPQQYHAGYDHPPEYMGATAWYIQNRLHAVSASSFSDYTWDGDPGKLIWNAHWVCGCSSNVSKSNKNASNSCSPASGTCAVFPSGSTPPVALSGLGAVGIPCISWSAQPRLPRVRRLTASRPFPFPFPPAGLAGSRSVRNAFMNGRRFQRAWNASRMRIARRSSDLSRCGLRGSAPFKRKKPTWRPHLTRRACCRTRG